VVILKRYLLDKVPVSNLCEELGLQPTVFYRWQKEFFENGADVFQGKERGGRQRDEEAETDRILGKEGADQGRGPGGVDGRARRAKKSLGEP
jgi:hypothetical protein